MIGTASDSFYLSSAPCATATVNYKPDKLNRYSAIGVLGLTALNPSYDARGNLLTWYSDNSTASKQTYGYDSENRLISAAVDASGNTGTYEYDALGRRQKKTVAPTAGGGSASVTQYLLDGDEEIAELDGSGVVQVRYVMGPAIDDRIARTDGSSTDTPNKLYYHANHQGSVVAMTDNTGAISCSSCQKFAYDEYGKLTSDLSSTQQQGEPFRYTGRRFDPDTGLYYYRARYYAPQMGRFLQTDPVGYKDDLDLYTYVGNDPTDKTDPSGLCFDNCPTSLTPDQAAAAGPIISAVADFVPVVGAVKGVIEAVQDPTALNVVAAVIGVVPEVGALGKDALKIGADVGKATAAEQRAANIAKGIPESRLGPSGKPMVHTVQHSTRKEAREAAQQEANRAGGQVRHDANPQDGQKPHFQAEDANGQNVKPVVHHCPPDCNN